MCAVASWGRGVKLYLRILNAIDRTTHHCKRITHHCKTRDNFTPQNKKKIDRYKNLTSNKHWPE